MSTSKGTTERDLANADLLGPNHFVAPIVAEVRRLRANATLRLKASKVETPGTQEAALAVMQEWDGPANRSLLVLIIEVRRLRALEERT